MIGWSSGKVCYIAALSVLTIIILTPSAISHARAAASTESPFYSLSSVGAGDSRTPSSLERPSTDSSSSTVYGCRGSEPPIIFSERGLPAGATWDIYISSGISSALGSFRGPTGMFCGANGTFSFLVGANGYSATPMSGSTTLSGVAKNVSIAFLPEPTYSLTVTSSGLSGTTAIWWLNLSGVIIRPASPTADITVGGIPNSTLTFGIQVPSGYSATPSHGTIAVNGANATEAITFSALPPPPTFLGLPNWEFYSILGGGIAAIVAGSLFLVAMTRRNRRGPS
jgi:hypothetical protein